MGDPVKNPCNAGGPIHGFYDHAGHYAYAAVREVLEGVESCTFTHLGIVVLYF